MNVGTFGFMSRTADAQTVEYRRMVAGRTDGELAAMYVTATGHEQRQIIHEMQIRDHCARQRAIRAAIREEWFLGIHADYLAAENETRGNLLSRDGIAAGVDPISLWSGRLDRAYRYASEELRAFWDRRPRITVTEYTRQATMRTV